MKHCIALLLAAVLLSLCACGLPLPEPLPSAPAETQPLSEPEPLLPALTPEPGPRFTVSFDPDEVFADEASRLAAERIDPVIEKAVELLNTVPDSELEILNCDFRDRPTEKDRLAQDEKALEWYDFLYEKLSGLEDFRLEPADHGGEEALYFPFYEAESALMTDHRELFLCAATWMGEDGSIYPIYFMPGDWVDAPSGDREAIRSAAAVYDRIVDRIFDKMPPGLSNYEKTCYFILVTALAAEYGEEGTGGIYSPYDALVLGRTVCHGYARTFYELCRRAEISVWFCEGASPDGIFHAWNRIDTASGPRYFDVTWYDTPELSTHYYDGDSYYLFMTREEYLAFGYQEGVIPQE